MSDEAFTAWHEAVIAKYPEAVQRELRLARAAFLSWKGRRIYNATWVSAGTV